MLASENNVSITGNNVSMTSDNKDSILDKNTILITGSQTANVQSENVQHSMQNNINKLLEESKVVKENIQNIQEQTIANNNNNKNISNVNATNVNVTPTKQRRYNNKLILINMVCLLLVLVGGINWGLHTMGVNVVEILSQLVNNVVSKLTHKNVNLNLNTFIYSAVFVASIVLASQRNVWLPFLGVSVLPSSLVPLKKPLVTNTQVSIKTKPNTKVAYWASLPVNNGDDKHLPQVMDAYNDFSNSGVVLSDNNGNAVLPIVSGTGYIVPSGRAIERHVHWRTLNDNGMMGPIMTKRY